jgi:hypothetical protein
VDFEREAEFVFSFVISYFGMISGYFRWRRCVSINCEICGYFNYLTQGTDKITGL